MLDTILLVGKRKLVLMIILGFVNCSLIAQSIKIEGFVLEDSSKVPLAYAQIYLNDVANNFFVTTISNLEGGFTIIVPNRYANDSLIISLVGFKSIVRPIKQLLDQEDVVVYLREQPRLLPSVTVTGQSALEVILSGLNHVDENYEEVLFTNNCYYWRSIREDSVYKSLEKGNLVVEEAIKKNHVTRKLMPGFDLDSTSSKGLLFLDSLANIFYFDLVRAGSSFMKTADIDEWTFAYDRATLVPDKYAVVDGIRKDRFMTIQALINEEDYSFETIDYSYNWSKTIIHGINDSLAYSLNNVRGKVLYKKNLTRYNIKYLFLEVSYGVYKRQRYRPYEKKFQREIKHELVVLSSVEGAIGKSVVDDETPPIIVNTKDYCEAVKALGLSDKLCN